MFRQSFFGKNFFCWKLFSNENFFEKIIFQWKFIWEIYFLHKKIFLWNFFCEIFFSARFFFTISFSGEFILQKNVFAFRLKYFGKKFEYEIFFQSFFWWNVYSFQKKKLRRKLFIGKKSFLATIFFPVKTFFLRNLKFGQNWVSNSWDIPDMDKCRQDKCCQDKCHCNS